VGLGNGRLSLVPVGRGVAFSYLAWALSGFGKLRYRSLNSVSDFGYDT